MAPSSRFVWFDYVTANIASARAFYQPVAGWTESAMGDYAMFKGPTREVAGITRAEGAAHWLGYVAVDDCDVSLARAKQLGATVEVPVTEIPEIGRFAIFVDRQGARCAMFQAAPGGTAVDPAAIGSLSWGELNSTDAVDAIAFYAELFGWTPAGEVPLGDGKGTYRIFGLDEAHPIGGMSDVAIAMQRPAHWLFYTNVANLDAAIAEVTRGGGAIMWGPQPVPGGGRIAGGADPNGAIFGLIGP
jgi:hypothetical protein